MIAPDSVGPLRPRQSLEQVAALCPQALALWDMSDEWTPEPVLVGNLGGALVELVFEDTLASSRIVNIRISYPPAKTAEGVGVGSTLGDLERAYGRARFDEVKCLLSASFERAQGLSFRLWLPKSFECTELNRLARSGSVPSDFRVQTVIVHGRDRGA